MSALRVAITGSSGLVGSRVAHLLAGSFDLVPLDRSNGFDLARPDASAWATTLPHVDAVLHLGAKTAVDEIETERGLGANSEAMIVNRDATLTLCDVAEGRSVPLVLVSTDFVFPASLRGPYPEDPARTIDPSETSWYGWTKALAEQATLARAENAVLRISYPFGPPHPTRMDHARRVLELHRQARLYPLFDDQVFTPSYIDDVAASLATILRTKLSGVYHCASTELTTPFEFGQRIVDATDSPGPPLVRGQFRTSIRPDRAPRPQHGGLATTLSRRNNLVCRELVGMVSDFAQHQTGFHHTSSARAMY